MQKFFAKKKYVISDSGDVGFDDSGGGSGHLLEPVGLDDSSGVLAGRGHRGH